MTINKKITGIACILFAASLAFPAAFAQPSGRRAAAASKMMDRRMSHLKQELKLTPEQEPALRRILEDNARQSMALRRKYGKPAENQQPNPERREELRSLHSQAQEKLKTVLNEEQLAKFRDLRKQKFEQFRSRRKG